MNKTDARIIAKTITNEQILEMFNNAKNSITEWTQVSTINFGITKGTAWNLLAYDFEVNRTYDILVKYNMIREFGDYLPEELKINKVKKAIKGPAYHQEPKFKEK
jgi:hypothetical protein